MSRFVRHLSVTAAISIAVAMLAVPATAEREARTGPRSRDVTSAVVHGRVTDDTQRRPTSFDLFSQRGRSTTAAGSSSVAPAPSVPTEAFGFDALADLDGAFPSDTTGALGDTFFVTATNIRTAVYTRTGTQVVAPTLLDSLHPDSSGKFAFDPKVIYDQYADTFLLVFLVQDDAPRESLIITVAIPNATAGDPLTWCATSYPGDLVGAAPDLWADYPAVGYNQSRVTISTNQFTFPSSTGLFRYAQVMTLDKTSLYDCNLPAAVPVVFAGTRTLDPNGIQAFTLQPAQTIETPAAQQYLLSAEIVGRGSYLTAWRIKSTLAGGLVLKKAILQVGRVGFPPLGTQGGGSLASDDTFWDAGDGRLINSFYDAARNELFAAHTVFRDFVPDTVTGGYPEAAVRWYEVNPARKLKNSVVSRKGIIGAPEVDVGWPSVATDSEGNLFVTFSRASQPHGEFISAYVADVEPTATVAVQTLLGSGLATYDVTGGPERWGDYTAINRDPLTASVVATFNQYALDATSWQQVVHTVMHT
jgi:hypothetical protein